MKKYMMTLMCLILLFGCININQYPEQRTREPQQPTPAAQPNPESASQPVPAETPSEPTPLESVVVPSPARTNTSADSISTPEIRGIETNVSREEHLNVSAGGLVNSTTNDSIPRSDSSSTNITASNMTNVSSNASRRFVIDPSAFVIDSIALAPVRVNGPKTTYFSGGNFQIEIDGIPTSIYDKVAAVLRSGESAYPNNVTSLFVGTYPSRSPRDVVIRSRVTRNRELESWRNSVVNGRIQRKSMNIITLDSEGRQTQRINYRNAWPSHYRMIVTSDGFEEEITIVSETVEQIS